MGGSADLWEMLTPWLYEHGYLGWEISQHTWIGYSQRTGKPDVQITAISSARASPLSRAAKAAPPGPSYSGKGDSG